MLTASRLRTRDIESISGDRAARPLHKWEMSHISTKTLTLVLGPDPIKVEMFYK